MKLSYTHRVLSSLGSWVAGRKDTVGVEAADWATEDEVEDVVAVVLVWTLTVEDGWVTLGPEDGGGGGTVGGPAVDNEICCAVAGGAGSANWGVGGGKLRGAAPAKDNWDGAGKDICCWAVAAGKVNCTADGRLMVGDGVWRANWMWFLVASCRMERCGVRPGVNCCKLTCGIWVLGGSKAVRSWWWEVWADWCMVCGWDGGPTMQAVAIPRQLWVSALLHSNLPDLFIHRYSVAGTSQLQSGGAVQLG